MRLQLCVILLGRDGLFLLLAKHFLANSGCAGNAMALWVTIAINGLIPTEVARCQSSLLLHVD